MKPMIILEHGDEKSRAKYLGTQSRAKSARRRRTSSLLCCMLIVSAIVNTPAILKRNVGEKNSC